MARQMCQSCGMPLKDGVRGSDVDGSASSHYCVHCYKEGAFTAPGATVDEMREYSIQGMTESGWPRFLAKFLTRNTGRLPRWQKTDTSVP